MTGSAGQDMQQRPAQGVWKQLHSALMPDYNRKASIYWWTMVLLGAAAWGLSLVQVAGLSALALTQLAGGVALAMLTGLFPMKIPRTNQVFSIGDVFIFLLLLTFGAAAGCLAAGLEAFVSACRSSKRWTTRLGSASIAAFSMYVAGKLLETLTGDLQSSSADHAGMLVLVTMVFGLLHSAFTAVLMSCVARLKRDEPLRLSDTAMVFSWVGAASAAAAAIAALLHITSQLAGSVVMLAIVPTLGLLLITLHFFSRQQLADEEVRRSAARALKSEAELAASQAREREAALASQHLRALETSERRFQSAFTHASIGMALVALDGTIHLGNPALHRLLGYGEETLHGQAFTDFVVESDQPRLVRTLADAAQGHAHPAPLELCCRTSNGAEAWVSVSCSVFSLPDAEGPSMIMQVQDVTARHIAELELNHRAFHDKLTGLPNRERFHQALGQAFQRDSGRPGQAFAVLFLDFDRFKLINDSKGHRVGDEFLVVASRRLEQCLRKGDMLARLGGDEFAILASNLHEDTDAVDLAERLLMLLREPLRLSTMEITATASIGITFSSMGYTRPEDMLRDADIAMYRAKVDGKARYALFDVQLHTEVANRVRLEADLRQALADQALGVAYQPLYNLQTGFLTGFEALSRWTHPSLGPVSPCTFVPIAEESGLITKLTEFMVETACRQLVAWQRGNPRGDGLLVHVNVAAGDLADTEFAGRVRRILLKTGLEARHLVIELTENILMAQLSAALGVLTELRSLGVGLSVDDFGTGYSSLSHLSVLPIDSLKIDMSFVRHLRADSKEAAVIQAIVLLGKSLGKEVIAEGVETQLQMDLLRALGCDIGQGYYLSRPLPADDMGKLIETVVEQHLLPDDAAPALLRRISMAH